MTINWLRNFGGRRANETIRRPRQTLRVEALEAREVLTTAALAGGVLTVTGTDAAEAIAVRSTNGQISVTGVSPTFSVAGVSRIDVRALGGDDVIDVRGVLTPLQLDGGTGADRFLVDKTNPVSVAGYGTADRVEFAAGANIKKSVVAASGSVWSLTYSGEVWTNGARKWTGKADLAFDAQSRVVTLDLDGDLHRTAEAYGGGTQPSQVMGRGVVKFRVAANGAVWALQADGQVFVNGQHGWDDKADFAFDSQNRVVFLGTGGHLSRSLSAYGNGGFGPLGDGVTKYQIDPKDRVWALTSAGGITIDGSGPQWDDKADFAFDAQNRLVFLDRGGWLGRSRSAYGNNGFDQLGTGVIKYQVAASGSVWALQSNGEVWVDGSRKWTGKADFAFDSQNRVVSLTLDGRLNRTAEAYGTGTQPSQPVGTGVVKYQIDPRDRVWALTAAGGVLIDGSDPQWDNKADFAFDSQNRVVFLDRSGLLSRSQQAYGNGGFDTLEVNVGGFSLAADGRALVTVPLAAVTDGVLRVYGTDRDDVIRLAQYGDAVSVAVNGTTVLSSVSAASLDHIEVSAGGGNDDVSLKQGDAFTLLGVTVVPGVKVAAVVTGGPGDDVLVGGAGDDVLVGGAGTDQLSGGDGNDILLGEDGTDAVLGDAGDDYLDAGPTGSDWLDGGYGNDVYAVLGGDWAHEDGNRFLRGGEAVTVDLGTRQGQEWLFADTGTRYDLDDLGVWDDLLRVGAQYVIEAVVSEIPYVGKVAAPVASEAFACLVTGRDFDWMQVGINVATSGLLDWLGDLSADAARWASSELAATAAAGSDAAGRVMQDAVLRFARDAAATASDVFRAADALLKPYASSPAKSLAQMLGTARVDLLSEVCRVVGAKLSTLD